MRGKEMFKRITPDELAAGDIFILPPDKKTNKLRLSSRSLSSQVKLRHGNGLRILNTCITKAPPNEIFVVTDTIRQDLSHEELMSYYAMNTAQLDIESKRPIRRVYFRPLLSMSLAQSHVHWIKDIRKEILGKTDPMMLDWRARWNAGRLLTEARSVTDCIPDLANSALRDISSNFPDAIPRVRSGATSRVYGTSKEIVDALQSGTLCSHEEFLNETAEIVFNKLIDNWDTSFPRSRLDIGAPDFSAFKEWLERGAIILRPVSKEASTFLLYEMFSKIAQSTYATNILNQANMEEAALLKLKKACAYDLKRLEQRKKYWLKFPQQLQKEGQKAAMAFEKILKEKSNG